MKNRSSFKLFATMLSVLASFGLVSGAKAADGGLPGGNTAEGDNALGSLTSGGFNTGLGWYSLFSNSDASYSTAVGAGALVLSDGTSNTAVGTAALLLNTTGTQNVAVGTDALVFNDDGSDNNAVGAFALFNHTTNNFNNAHGRNALYNNIDGDENNAFGDDALENSTHDSHNSAFGDNALLNCDGGDANTAMGRDAGASIIDGDHNVCIGDFAGDTIVHASHSIAIGVPAAGPFADFDNTCFIGSIHGELVSDPGSAQDVYVDVNNVVGIIASSRKFKHDIQPMDKASETLYSLKPVTFKYNSDQKGTTQYGLVAEDVAEVNPDLVSHDKDGELSSVRYAQVNAMLLNEFLKEHKKVQDLQATVAQQQKGMEVLTAQLKEQAAQIQKVSAKLEVSKPAPQIVANKP